jgi:beta-galactosidase
MRRMLVRDRGHACVAAWSLGNEAGYGDVFPLMAAEARRLDPETRPVQYADMNLAADMDSQTYPTVPWLRQHLAGTATRKGEQGQSSNPAQHGAYPTGKPFFMNEYAHARGNALGTFAAYWEVMRANRQLIGGCVWDWHDLDLTRMVDGRRVPARGGDFGDRPNDGDFAGCGLVDAWGRPHPHLAEVIHVQQPFAVLPGTAPGLVRLQNRHHDLDLAVYALRWELGDDGTAIASGCCDPPSIPAGATVEVAIPGLAAALAAPGGERVLRLTFHRDGREVGWDELRLGGTWRPAALPARPGTAPVCSEDCTGALIADADASCRIDRNGRLASWRVRGEELLVGPVHSDFWRAPTSADRGWQTPHLCAPWRRAGADARLVRRDIRRDGTLRIEDTLALAGIEAACRLTWTFHTASCLELRVDLDAAAEGVPLIPRIGTTWPLHAGFQHLTWYGRGPGESYRDRCASAGLGCWNATVDALGHVHPRPQETGNRSEVRWCELIAASGRRLRIESLADPIDVSALPWTREALEDAEYGHLLKPSGCCELHLDHGQMGLGGDCTWGERPYAEHLLAAQQPRSWAFRIHAS